MQTLSLVRLSAKQRSAFLQGEWIKRLGYWSALCSLVFALGYSIAQAASWLKLVRPPGEQVWLFLPSLFLAPAFLIVVISLHYKTFGDREVFTAIGIGFATVYCAFATLTYFTQLASVYPLIKSGQATADYAFTFKPRSFTMAIDCLGYFFMSLSTLFTSFAFKVRQPSLNTWMLVNGVLIVLLIPAYFYPVLYYFASVWTPVFAMAMISAMRFFRNKEFLSFI